MTYEPFSFVITQANFIFEGGVAIRYEFFVSKLEETEGIFSEGERNEGRPYLAGLHLGIEPLEGWSIGLYRMLQFGGDGRKVSFSQFMKAFFDPASGDNTSDELDSDEELGNQMASLTSRFNFNGKVPFSVYMEYAGEDTSDRSGFRLGNISTSLGIFLPRITENVDFTWEFSVLFQIRLHFALLIGL